MPNWRHMGRTRRRIIKKIYGPDRDLHAAWDTTPGAQRLIGMAGHTHNIISVLNDPGTTTFAPYPNLLLTAERFGATLALDEDGTRARMSF